MGAWGREPRKSKSGASKAPQPPKNFVRRTELTLTSGNVGFQPTLIAALYIPGSEPLVLRHGELRTTLFERSGEAFGLFGSLVKEYRNHTYPTCERQHDGPRRKTKGKQKERRHYGIPQVPKGPASHCDQLSPGVETHARRINCKLHQFKKRGPLVLRISPKSARKETLNWCCVGILFYENI